VWVNGLPQEAATRRVDGWQWTVQEELLAMLLERVDTWGLANARLAADSKTRRALSDAKPIEVPRPGKAPKESRDRVVTDPREIAAFFS
jgi:hypothetical protein